MTTALYTQIMIATLIGLTFQVLIKIILLNQKAKLSNVEFSVKQFFKDDKWALAANVLASFAIIYVISEYMDLDGRILSKIKSIFIFVGFTGSELLMRLLSVASKRVNAAIDDKTNQIDRINNTLDKPTPAVMPKDKV